MIFYNDVRARNSFSISITYTVGNKTEDKGCRYGSSHSGSGSKRAATHVPSSAAEPHRAVQDARGKQRDPYRPERLRKYYLDTPFLKTQKTDGVFITEMKCSLLKKII
jgi:hypothetical protein